MRCHFVTSSSEDNYGGRRYLPYVFTEHGITMLAGLLKSDIAINRIEDLEYIHKLSGE